MQVLSTVLLAVQMLSALIMIGLILVQHGKGADMGAAFGGGASGSLFGASGSANFMSRATGILAAVFFVCTLGLAYLSGVRPAGIDSVLDKAAVTAPVSGASAPISAVLPASGAASGAGGGAAGAVGLSPAAIPTGPSAAQAPVAGVTTPAVAASSSAIPGAITGTPAPIPTK